MTHFVYVCFGFVYRFANESRTPNRSGARTNSKEFVPTDVRSEYLKTGRNSSPEKNPGDKLSNIITNNDESLKEIGNFISKISSDLESNSSHSPAQLLNRSYSPPPPKSIPSSPEYQVAKTPSRSPSPLR